MKPGSVIVNVASAAALTSGGLPQAAYTASKAGLIGLTRDLAVQWTGRKDFRVVALAPGLLPVRDDGPYPDGYLASQLARIPAGRLGDVAELGLRSCSWRAPPATMSPAPRWWWTGA
jgi:NAD(P)-dependent dehydrogenase (short-subunit alcohol dehydrogenase family)